MWATTLSVAADVLEKFSTTLSPDEKERANKFKFEKHRHRYLAGRGALRTILAQYLDARAADLRFDYLTNGKPAFAQAFARAGIHFNLAHTEDLALIAVTRIGRLGVDVECVRPVKNVDELVARFFSERENKLFQNVPNAQKPSAFFNLWTRKEAMLKATGEGITRSLSLVEVSFLPGEPAKLLAIAGDAKAGARWKMWELTPAVGFTGAVAIESGTSNAEPGTSNIQPPTSNIQLGEEVGLRCWKWTSNFEGSTKPQRCS